MGYDIGGGEIGRAFNERYSNKIVTKDLVFDTGVSSTINKVQILTFNEFKKKELSSILSYGRDFSKYLHGLLKKDYSTIKIHQIMENQDEHYLWRRDFIDLYIHSYHKNVTKKINIFKRIGNFLTSKIV